jgi:hypothetical protein
MRNQNQPTGCAGASNRTRRLALTVPLLGALLGGCGAGTADDVAQPLAVAAPATAAISAHPLPAMTAPVEMLAAVPATTTPTPAAAAVGSDAAKDTVLAAAKPAAPAGRRAAAPTRSLSIPLALDGELAHPIVIECVEASGAGAVTPQPSIPQCPAGDALPPASSPRFVSALQVVDSTAGRDAGVLPLSR